MIFYYGSIGHKGKRLTLKNAKASIDSKPVAHMFKSKGSICRNIICPLEKQNKNNLRS